MNGALVPAAYTPGEGILGTGFFPLASAYVTEITLAVLAGLGVVAFVMAARRGHLRNIEDAKFILFADDEVGVPTGARTARDREASDREALPTGHRERSGGSGSGASRRATLSPSPNQPRKA